MGNSTLCYEDCLEDSPQVNNTFTKTKKLNF